MMCPFRTGATCSDVCALYVKEHECCAFKYQAVKDIKQNLNREEIRSKFREIFNRRG